MRCRSPKNSIGKTIPAAFPSFYYTNPFRKKGITKLPCFGWQCNGRERRDDATKASIWFKQCITNTLQFESSMSPTIKGLERVE